MPLEELPESERTCGNCRHDDDDTTCLECPRTQRYCGGDDDNWDEHSHSLRKRAEKRIAELEAHCREADAARAEAEAVVLSLEGTVERLTRERDEALDALCRNGLAWVASHISKGGE